MYKNNSICINNIRYADDAVFIADNISGFQQQFRKVSLNVNVNEMKLTIVTRVTVTRIRDRLISGGLRFNDCFVESVNLNVLGHWDISS